MIQTEVSQRDESEAGRRDGSPSSLSLSEKASASSESS